MSPRSSVCCLANADAGSYAPVTVLVDEPANDFSRAVADGVVYVSTYDGYVYALSASSGAKLWRNKVGLGGITSSAVANGVVYVSESNGNVYALSARTGDILWSNPTRGTYLNSSPIVVNGVVYVNSIDLYDFGLK